MTDRNTLRSNPAEAGAELTDLAPAVQELSVEEAQSIRGGLLPAISSLDGDGKSLKITDGTSNTITFSWGVTQIG